MVDHNISRAKSNGFEKILRLSIDGRIRTFDHLIRNQGLQPTELHAYSRSNKQDFDHSTQGDSRTDLQLDTKNRNDLFSEAD